MLMGNRLPIITALAVVGLALAGCGGDSSKEEAETLVKDFYSAVNDADGERACSLVSEEALQQAYQGKDNCVGTIESLGEDNVRRAAESLATQGREAQDALLGAFQVVAGQARAEGAYPAADAVEEALAERGWTVKRGDADTAADNPLENRQGTVVVGEESTRDKLVLYAGARSGEVVQLTSPLKGRASLKTVKKASEKDRAEEPLVRIQSVEEHEDGFLVLFQTVGLASTQRYLVTEVDGDLRISGFR